MKYNILKDEIYRTSYLICESLFLEEEEEERKRKIEEDGRGRERSRV
jgi:hypothetical protein